MKKIVLFLFPALIFAQQQENKKESEKLHLKINESKSLFDSKLKQNLSLDNNQDSIVKRKIELNLLNAGKNLKPLSDTNYNLFNNSGVMYHVGDKTTNPVGYNLYDGRPLNYLNNYLDKHSK